MDNKSRIWITKYSRSDLLHWSHKMLFHPGARIFEDSVRTNFTCPGLSKLCVDLTAKCAIYSEMKLTNVVKDSPIPIKEEN